MQTIKQHEIRYQLSSVVVDAKTGTLRNVTVAKAGVAAQGHYLSVDSEGMQTQDPDQIRRELPVMTDEETLKTLMAAAVSAGGRFKVRSDHDDAISSRAGYADNFQIIEDRVVCDVHLNESYRDREIVMEVAKNTPELMGLSIDFLPSFEIGKNEALMRVQKLNAVDIVDAGAITPAGLFLKEGVDKSPNGILSMETKQSDKPTELAALAAAVLSLTSKFDELSAKLAAVDEKKKKKDDSEDDSDEDDQMSAVNAKLAEHTASLLALRKDQAALGLKAGASLVSPEATAPEAKPVEKPKTYLELVSELKTSGKFSAGAAHREAMRANPAAYATHLKSLGVAK
jgi:hypothetical protein